jgi:hypothetical protein
VKPGLQLLVLDSDGPATGAFAVTTNELGSDSAGTRDHVVFPAVVGAAYPCARWFAAGQELFPRAPASGVGHAVQLVTGAAHELQIVIGPDLVQRGAVRPRR